MRFNRSNPKFLMDIAILLMAVAVIVLAIVVIIYDSMAVMAAVFYVGAAMFAANIARGLWSRRYLAIAFVVPMAICVAGALAAQGVVGLPWS